MLFLMTGLPGASKTLNTLADLVSKNDGTRQIFYHNISLLMLDYEVCSSFSGWFYGRYYPNLKDKKAKLKLDRVIKRVHGEGRFCVLDDLPWLEALFEAANPVDLWLAWVRKLYSSKQLSKMEEFILHFDGILSFQHLARFNLHFAHFDNPREWFDLPLRSIVFVDECQQFFPPRAIGSVVPRCVSEFETHRHKGFDVYLVTQNAKLIDVNLRRLVGSHIHFYNPFGGSRVTRYLSAKCMDTDGYFDLRDAEKSFLKRPILFYGAYHSAEIHTHKFRLPKSFKIGLVLLLVLAVSLYLLFDVFISLSPESLPDVVGQSEIVEPVHPSGVSLVKSSEGVLNLDAERLALLEFFKSLLSDVYISGSMSSTLDGHQFTYDYSFFRKQTGEVFYPESLGLNVSAVSACFARLSLDDFLMFVSCDPFYLHPVKRDKQQDKYSDKQEKSFLF